MKKMKYCSIDDESTVEAWVYPALTSTTEMAVVGKDDGSGTINKKII